LLAAQEAGRIYRHVEGRKGRENFVTEVSVDETGAPQNAVELYAKQNQTKQFFIDCAQLH
jgi:hypothetical protein